MQRKDSLEDFDAVHSWPHTIEENKTESSSTTRIRGALRANAAAVSPLAPRHCPAVRLKVLGDVVLAPVPVAPLSRRSPTEPAPPTLLHPTVENHVHGLVGEDMREVCDPRRFRARDDDKQHSHRLPPRDYPIPIHPATAGTVEKAGGRGLVTVLLTPR